MDASRHNQRTLSAFPLRCPTHPGVHHGLDAAIVL